MAAADDDEHDMGDLSRCLFLTWSRPDSTLGRSTPATRRLDLEGKVAATLDVLRLPSSENARDERRERRGRVCGAAVVVPLEKSELWAAGADEDVGGWRIRGRTWKPGT